MDIVGSIVISLIVLYGVIEIRNQLRRINEGIQGLTAAIDRQRDKT